MDNYRVITSFGAWYYRIVCQQCYDTTMRYAECQGHYNTFTLVIDVTCAENDFPSVIEAKVKEVMAERGLRLGSFRWLLDEQKQPYNILNLSARERDRAKLQASETDQPLSGEPWTWGKQA